MRIFETVAAGAVAICEDHPFIRDAFGDNVLYINVGDNPDETVRQISSCMAFVRTHPDHARSMTARAHEIFSEHYTLERLMRGVEASHEKLLATKFRPKNDDRKSTQKSVQVIMRIGGRPLSMIRRALNSVVSQTYRNVEVF